MCKVNPRSSSTMCCGAVRAGARAQWCRRSLQPCVFRHLQVTSYSCCCEQQLPSSLQMAHDVQLSLFLLISIYSVRQNGRTLLTLKVAADLPSAPNTHTNPPWHPRGCSCKASLFWELTPAPSPNQWPFTGRTSPIKCIPGLERKQGRTCRAEGETTAALTSGVI